MPDVNIWAVLAAGVGSLVLGGIWYSPLLFARRWQRETGLTEERLAGGNMVLIFGLAFALSLIAAYVFDVFVGHMGLLDSIHTGFAVGLGLVGASFGINYLFERRSFALWSINAGYHILQFTLFGLLFGLIK